MGVRLVAGVGKGKNELVSDNNSFLPPAAAGGGGGVAPTAAMRTLSPKVFICGVFIPSPNEATCTHHKNYEHDPQSQGTLRFSILKQP